MRGDSRRVRGPREARKEQGLEQRNTDGGPGGRNYVVEKMGRAFTEAGDEPCTVREGVPGVENRRTAGESPTTGTVE